METIRNHLTNSRRFNQVLEPFLNLLNISQIKEVY